MSGSFYTALNSTGLHACKSAGNGLQTASGWGNPNNGSDAGLFYYNYNNLDNGNWNSGARLKLYIKRV